LQHQYIGATMFLAPIYWCYDVRSTTILLLLVLAAKTNISPYSFVYHVVKCTVFGGFFSMFSSWRLIWLHTHPLSRQ
jgi:hypothetical protein